MELMDNKDISGEDGTASNSGAAVQFLEAILHFMADGENRSDPDGTAQVLLKLTGCQSLVFLASDGSGGDLLPQLTAGNHQDLLRACFYRADEGIAGYIRKASSPVVVDMENLPEDFILIRELAKNTGFSALMGSPVVTGTGRQGILLLLGEEGRKTFSREDLALTGAFATLLSLSWRFRRAGEKLQKRSQELNDREFQAFTVYQVSKSLASIMDIQRITEILADMLVEILNITHALVYLSDENEEKLQLKATRYLDPSAEKPSVEITVSDKNPRWLLSINFESRIILNFEDEGFNEAFPDAAWIFKELDITAIVPMTYNYKLVGFLALGPKYITDGFATRDFDFLSTVGPMAAGAISNAHLYEMAILDGLTKVYLGRYFRQRCREEIKRARRYKNILSIIMWDIDHFKEINDTHGHLAGDAVLAELSRMLKDGLRQDIDMVARYGGEEFVMLLPDTSGDGAMIMAERLRQRIEQNRFLNGTINVTVSGGIATFPDDGADYLSLVEQADIQLYRAKRDGRNRIKMKGLQQGPVK